MSLVVDSRPSYTSNFTAPTDAVAGVPGTTLTIPSNTTTLIIYNREPIAGTVLQYAIYDTFGGRYQNPPGAASVPQPGPPFASIPAATLPQISAGGVATYLQQIGIGYVIAGAALTLDIGPENPRASLSYVPTTSAGYINVLTPLVVAVGNTFTSGAAVLTAIADVAAAGTITVTTPIAGDTVTVNGVVFTAVASTVTPTSVQFQLSTTNTLTAVNLAAAIANHTTLASAAPWVRASSVGAVVTINAQGAAGNAVTLATSTVPRLPISGATLAAGAGPGVDQFIIAVATTTTTAAGITANNIAVAINAVANSFDAIFDATATTSQPTGAPATVGGRVTLASDVTGIAANNITLSEVGAGLVVSGPYMTGATPDRYVMIFQGVAGTVSTSVTLIQGLPSQGSGYSL